MKEQEVTINIIKDNITTLNKSLKLQKKKPPLTWEGMYELAETYYNHHGNLLIPLRFKTKNGIDEDKEGYTLGRWIQQQRMAYKNRNIPKEERKNSYSSLTDEQVDKLLDIEMIFDSTKERKNELKWNQMYELAKSYYHHHGHLFVRDNFKTINGYDYDKNGKRLDTWINQQRIAYKNRDIPKEERKNSYSSLTDEQVDKLLEIGMIFDRVEQARDEYNWNKMYKLAQSYYDYYGHLLVPDNFKTKNGIDYDLYGYTLGLWIKTQRTAYKNRFIEKEKRTNTNLPLTDERLNKLLEIGMIFDRVEETIDNYNWNKMYELAKKYYNYYKNLFIPQDFKTKNGYFYDEDGYALGVWLNTQRISYKNRIIPKEQITNTRLPLSDEKVKKLLEIGIVFERVEQARDEYIWNQMYKLAVSYYNYHGNLLIPESFETTNGYEFEEDGYKLGSWIRNQRLAYKNRGIPKEERKTSYSPLTDEQVNKLSKIGMVFDRVEQARDEYIWNQMYKLAVSYYNHHGNLLIPQDFKTRNGYEFEEDGYKLGLWIKNQRLAYKNRDIPKEERKYSNVPLTDDRLNKLVAIDMVFNKKENKQDCIKLCKEYGLDVKKYPYLKDNISYRELNAKINFLLYIDMPIKIDNKPHEIFFMTNTKMIEIYSISKQELIEKYYNENMNKSR